MSNPSPPASQTRIVTDALASEIVQNTTLHLNLAQNAIVTTEDKLRLCLIEHLRGLEAKGKWVAPAGILATIVAAFATTSFHDFYLDAATWRALFLVAGLVDAAWLLRSVVQTLRSPRLDDVVNEIKKAGAIQAREKA